MIKLVREHHAILRVHRADRNSYGDPDTRGAGERARAGDAGAAGRAGAAARGPSVIRPACPKARAWVRVVKRKGEGDRRDGVRSSVRVCVCVCVCVWGGGRCCMLCESN